MSINMNTVSNITATLEPRLLITWQQTCMSHSSMSFMEKNYVIAINSRYFAWYLHQLTRQPTSVYTISDPWNDWLKHWHNCLTPRDPHHSSTIGALCNTAVFRNSLTPAKPATEVLAHWNHWYNLPFYCIATLLLCFTTKAVDPQCPLPILSCC